MTDVREFFVRPGDSLRTVMECINRIGSGIALMVTPEGKLGDTITDGDLRRAILRGISLETDISVVAMHKASLGGGRERPVVARTTTPAQELLRLMTTAHVRWLPLLAADDTVASIVSLESLISESTRPRTPLRLQAAVIAGGFGTRLLPLTQNIPKPMLPVGDCPVLELTIKRLRDAGVRKTFIATHHMADQIRHHFGDGSNFDMEIAYVQEEMPLGTAGALTLLPPIDERLLVINGDILTSVDFRAMLREHSEQGASLTVALRQHDIEVPYGVVDCDGSRVTALREKPSQHFLVNAGVYILDPGVVKKVPRGRPFNMTDLIEQLIAEKLPVVGFPIVEYWLDIGRHADYEQAQRDHASGRI